MSQFTSELMAEFSRKLAESQQQLAAAKLREAAAIRAHSDEQAIAVQMQQGRDAALSALDHLGERVSQAVFTKEPQPCIFVNSTELKNAIDNVVAHSVPLAELAERDRAIREECIQTYHAVYSDMVHSGIPFHITADFFPAVESAIREFNLEPK